MCSWPACHVVVLSLSVYMVCVRACTVRERLLIIINSNKIQPIPGDAQAHTQHWILFDFWLCFLVFVSFYVSEMCNPFAWLWANYPKFCYNCIEWNCLTTANNNRLTNTHTHILCPSSKFMRFPKRRLNLLCERTGNEKTTTLNEQWIDSNWIVQMCVRCSHFK